MSDTSKITLKYESTWNQNGGIFDEEMIPQENILFEIPAEDLNTIQLFQVFKKFSLVMGHSEEGIAKGATHIAFNEMRSYEDMKKTADEYDLVLMEDYTTKVSELEENSLIWEKRYWDYKKNAEKEIRNLKAKISRLENPDNPQYTDEEMNALCSDAEEKDKKTLVKKLQNAYNVCHDCGKKYGTYSVGSSSTYMGKCNVCEQERPITEARDYGWLKKGISELLNDV